MMLLISIVIVHGVGKHLHDVLLFNSVCYLHKYIVMLHSYEQRDVRRISIEFLT